MIWAFKQSPEVCYAVPLYNYLMQMEEIRPWNFGQFAVIFQRGEDNFSSSHLIHSQKAKELLKEEKSYALPYKFDVLGQIGPSKQCRPRSDCF